MRIDHKEIDFYKYCKSCKNRKCKEYEDPCHECLKALIHVGISEILYKEVYEKEDIVNVTKRIAKFCNVKLRKLGDN